MRLIALACIGVAGFLGYKLATVPLDAHGLLMIGLVALGYLVAGLGLAFIALSGALKGN